MDVSDKIAFKTAVKQEFLTLLEQRMQHAEHAMQEAQANANSHEKSSVGDKYETSRAMSQIDRDMNAAQLLQAQQDYKTLTGLPVNTVQEQIAPGSLFELENGIYFAALGLGQLMVENRIIIAISIKSPLFENFKAKKQGARTLFRGKELTVLDVY